MEIPKQDKIRLQKLMGNGDLKVIRTVANALILNWDRQSCVKDTEFETLKAIIEKESKIKGLTILFDELERNAHDE